jgi:hypothetical protein
MSYTVRIFPRDRADVQEIYNWLSERSEQGASSWFERFQQTVGALQADPLMWPIADESKHLDYEIRHRLFRTRRGRMYRVLFAVVGSAVRVLRVRGPGHPPLKRGDVE